MSPKREDITQKVARYAGRACGASLNKRGTRRCAEPAVVYIPNWTRANRDSEDEIDLGGWCACAKHNAERLAYNASFANPRPDEAIPLPKLGA